MRSGLVMAMACLHDSNYTMMVFVKQVRMVVAGGFIVMVWHDRKEAVGIVKVDVARWI